MHLQHFSILKTGKKTPIKRKKMTETREKIIYDEINRHVPIIFKWCILYPSAKPSCQHSKADQGKENSSMDLSVMQENEKRELTIWRENASISPYCMTKNHNEPIGLPSVVIILCFNQNLFCCLYFSIIVKTSSRIGLSGLKEKCSKQKLTLLQ